MNEVRSTNELFPRGARDRKKLIVLHRKSKERHDQASLNGIGERRARMMTWPSAGAPRERSISFGGQASKSIRWMPWHQEAMKDVVKLRKATVSRIQALTRRSPNRETDIELCRCGSWLNT